ncbi:MAG: hypothetical protein ACTHN0_12275 [Aquihabitans sp.]
MKVWKKAAAVTAAIALSATIGAVAASAIGAQDPGPAPSGDTRLLGNGISENKYVPIIPCRILDTRKGFGKFGEDTQKAIDVRGNETTFVAQGGNPGGCGIPNSATAIEATITAVTPDDGGYLRAWPANLVEPNATFLNYTPSFNVGNTGTITLCGANGLSCNANQDLNLRTRFGATHLVIDIAGYYQQPMSANVTSAGALSRSSRATSASRDGTGVYRVYFDRNISQCTYFAGTATANGSVNLGFASVTNLSATNTGLSVQTFNTDGVLTDKAFQVEVIC